MTLGNLRKRILALLDVNPEDTGEGSFFAVAQPLMIASINAISDKVALALRTFYKEAVISFQSGAFGAKAALPKDFAAVRGISGGGKFYGGECFEIVGDHIYFFAGKAVEYTLCYYAFPEAFTEESAEDTTLAFDDYASDTVAYGVAAELCHSLYPSDMTRYARLATEFDERVTAQSLRAGETVVANSLFCRKRGDLR